MKTARVEAVVDDVTAYGFVLAALAGLAASCPTLDEGVRERLDASARRFQGNRTLLLRTFAEYAKKPNAADEPLFAAAREFDLTATEILAVRLAVAIEEDVLAGHLLAHLQQPLVQSRPTIGLLAHAFGEERNPSAIHVLAHGAAVRCGLLQLSAEGLPLPERHVSIPLPNSLALQGMSCEWPGASIVPAAQIVIPLGASSETYADALSARLFALKTEGAVVVVRGGDGRESRAAAERIASGLGKRPAFIHTDHVAAMAPWLFLNGMLPVFALWLSPGERKPVPAIPCFAGPTIVLTGPEGDFESDHRVLLEWRLGVPSPAEREELWVAGFANRELAKRVAYEHRQTAGRIAALAGKVNEAIGARTPMRYEDITAAARRAESTGLGALSEVILDDVDDAALVVPEALREELEALVVRCRLREQFASSLGPSIRARYRPSVRALFLGASGTGKTLAAAWLATRLGIPLCRVDLSAITSKYIGETEKNLSQLLSRAEQNEVVLLFDEADSLFGKRTDIHDSNDRFANAQTNYLLQRMESYDGITVLTSNGRGRFDAAFSRRFDAILTFPLPGPEERRALWSAHIGDGHGVSVAQLNQLAAVAELSGGQIRNAVLRAAVGAAKGGERIRYRHLLIGVSSEYRKLSRQLPSELKQRDDPEPV